MSKIIFGTGMFDTGLDVGLYTLPYSAHAGTNQVNSLVHTVVYHYLLWNNWMTDWTISGLSCSTADITKSAIQGHSLRLTMPVTSIFHNSTFANSLTEMKQQAGITFFEWQLT